MQYVKTKHQYQTIFGLEKDTYIGKRYHYQNPPNYCFLPIDEAMQLLVSGTVTFTLLESLKF